MGDKTGIGWTESTWTTVTGCTRVSPGCGGPGPHGGCYAEILSARKLAHLEKYKGVAHIVGGKDDGEKVHGGDARWTGLIRTHPDALDQPLRWRKPRRIFVNSMSDLFHKDVPDEFIAAVFGIMAATPHHAYQVLTKRAERLPEWFAWVGDDATRAFRAMREHLVGGGRFGLRKELLNDGVPWPLPNVHLGVSVEDQQRADERIPFLLRTPAAVRWVSAEPLLGPVDLRPFLPGPDPDGRCRQCGHDWTTEGPCRAHGFGPFIGWVVVGGESGPRHRPMDLAWLQSIHDQCKAARVPLYVKQDSGPRPGKQGRIPDDLWAVKDYPEVTR